MENTDIIVLTAIISVLFLVFIIATYREFTVMGKTEFKGGKESGPPADLMRFIGSVFIDDRIDVKKKIRIIDAVKNAMEDNAPSDESDINKKNDSAM